ncbi:Acyl-CoA-binding domain-containing protein 4 [Apostasia shenzhenica]|uniref:Acyl-CoA-binding domain-containing protein 4 n=1 Tax=Apostasia shenzhenica TaxID=1088818 RepID=A0A2I0AH88_9ASPA|nr:Acyl-CoA-binding domain-containing protein 4 [Apostasia shenzhenica]
MLGEAAHGLCVRSAHPSRDACEVVRLVQPRATGTMRAARGVASRPPAGQPPSSLKPKFEPVHKPNIPNGNPSLEPKIIPADNGTTIKTQDKDIIMEGLGVIGVYDKWIAPSISGHRPRPRYQHGAAVVQDKMYIFGGNHNGHYLSDLQIDVTVSTASSESSMPTKNAPCAGHSLISWDNKILSIAGHTKDLSETVAVKEFDPHTCKWSNVKTYGKAPISRGGQSVTLVGTTLVMFGGEDAKRSLLNDLHILDLETMTWDDVDAIGTPPSPRSDHAAACHAERYLLIFGGGSHATCFNDLHVLDLQTMEWSRPKQQGVTPGPRAGHAGITVGENWFIVGGGDNKHGASETLVLNMSTLVWSVVVTVQGRVPVASEGLSLALATCNGDDYLVSFGGYNGRYSNEVYVLKPSHKSDVQSKVIERSLSDSMAALVPSTNVIREVEPQLETAPDGKVREILMDNVDSESLEVFDSQNCEILELAPLWQKFVLNVSKNVRTEVIGDHALVSLKAEKEELEATLNKEQLLSLQLRQELAEAETRNTETMKELQSVRSQLAAEQSRCFKLEVDLAELRQKLQNMETLQKEVELLQRQKAASEQAALAAKQRQSSGGVWGWLAGTPPDKNFGSL